MDILRWLAAAVFVVAACAADAHELFGWPTLTWLAIGLALWVASETTQAARWFGVSRGRSTGGGA